MPLVSSITAMHVLSSSSRVRAIVRRSEPYLMDTTVYATAVTASYHLNHHLIEGFSRRREERRISAAAHGGVSHRGMEGGQLLRVYALFLYHKLRQEKSLYASGIILLGWLLYLAKGKVATARVVGETGTAADRSGRAGR